MIIAGHNDVLHDMRSSVCPGQLLSALLHASARFHVSWLLSLQYVDSTRNVFDKHSSLLCRTDWQVGCQCYWQIQWIILHVFRYLPGKLNCVELLLDHL